MMKNLFCSSLGSDQSFLPLTAVASKTNGIWNKQASIQNDENSQDSCLVFSLKSDAEKDTVIGFLPTGVCPILYKWSV